MLSSLMHMTSDLMLSFLSDIHHLHLDQVVYDFSPGPAHTLPNATHLNISNLGIPGDRRGLVLGSAHAPALTHLAVHDPSYPSLMSSHDMFYPDIDALPVHHLESVVIAEVDPWATSALAEVSPQMGSLKTLTMSGFHSGEVAGDVCDILERLPRSLETFDIATASYHAVLVSVFCDIFEEGSASVAELRSLRLPVLTSWRLPEYVNKVEAMGHLQELASLAEESGVVVEWV